MRKKKRYINLKTGEIILDGSPLHAFRVFRREDTTFKFSDMALYNPSKT